MAKKEEEIKKVKRSTALKRDDQSEKRRLKNRSYKSSVRTAIRHFEDALPKGDASAIEKSLSDVYSMMDKGVKTGVFKLNKASRTKARLAARAASK